MKIKCAGIDKTITEFFDDKNQTAAGGDIGSLCTGGKKLKVNLQLFADSGEKTEKATPRKKQKARKEGQVLQSREMTAAIVLLCMFTGLRAFGGFMYEEILGCFRKVFTVYFE
jgi:hypothetical protein